MICLQKQSFASLNPFHLNLLELCSLIPLALKNAIEPFMMQLQTKINKSLFADLQILTRIIQQDYPTQMMQS